MTKFRLKKSNYPYYNGMDELSPEVLSMLKNMNSNKRNQTQVLRNESYGEAAVTTTKSKRIALSDQEFGKY